jgi:hypothetical protein
MRGNCFGFDVLTAINVMITIFWDVTTCSLVVHRSFGGTYSLLPQGRRVSQGSNQQEETAGRTRYYFSENEIIPLNYKAYVLVHKVHAIKHNFH